MKIVDFSAQFIDERGRKIFYQDGDGTDPVIEAHVMAQILSQKADPLPPRKVPNFVEQLRTQKHLMLDESDLSDVKKCVEGCTTIPSLTKGILLLRLDDAKNVPEVKQA